MLWINGKMTDLTKKDAIHKLVDAKSYLERYSNPHDKWTEAINIGIEAIEIVMAQEEQEPTDKNFNKADVDSIVTAINAHWELIIDEIRADIQNGIHHFLDGEPIIEIKEVLQILDKYKAESEET